MDENPYESPQTETLHRAKARNGRRAKRGLLVELVVLQIVLLVIGLAIAAFFLTLRGGIPARRAGLGGLGLYGVGGFSPWRSNTTVLIRFVGDHL